MHCACENVDVDMDIGKSIFCGALAQMGVLGCAKYIDSAATFKGEGSNILSVPCQYYWLVVCGEAFYSATLV